MLPALLRAFPRLSDSLPYVGLCALPTPVERADELGAALGLGALWVKRDDASAEVYGGGKPRKLEFLLGAARAADAGAVVTTGGVGSNHALATAALARVLGMRAVLMLLPEPRTDAVRAKLLAEIGLGAELRMSPKQGPALQRATARLTALYAAERPYVVPTGGSSPTGNLGFVSAGFELREQVEQGLVPPPERIYLALGTMGSAVGLAIGLRAAGLRCPIHAVRASSPGTSSRSGFARQYAETVSLLRARDPSFPDVHLDAGDVAIVPGYLGAGYARPTRKGLLAMELARANGGYALEPTYTAKALAALTDDAPALDARPILFWLSHSSRPLPTAAPATALPAAFRGYGRRR